MLKHLLPRQSPAAPGPLAQRDGADPRPVVLVTLLCATPGQTAEALTRHGAARSHDAVFVLSAPDPRPLRQAGAVFEHLPAPAMVQRFAGQGDWPAYLAERWRMLHRKWQPRWIASYGLDFDKYLKECGFSGTLRAFEG